LDPPTYEWLTEILPGKPIVDNWWQTETGWPIVSNCLGLGGDVPQVKAGSATFPVPGFNVQILDTNAKPVAPNIVGNICIKLPLPPGSFPTVWQSHDRMVSSYLSTYPGYYITGDGGYRDEEGYVFIMGRTDDVINVAGHRLSTGEMEELVGSHPDVAECAVVAIEDRIKGHIPVGFIVLKDQTKTTSQQIQKDLVQKVRNDVGAVASFQKVLVVERLPKTRSGKILRKTISELASHPSKDVPVPATIDDASILVEIAKALETAKVGPMWDGGGEIHDKTAKWKDMDSVSTDKNK